MQLLSYGSLYPGLVVYGPSSQNIPNVYAQHKALQCSISDNVTFLGMISSPVPIRIIFTTNKQFNKTVSDIHSLVKTVLYNESVLT